MTLLCNSTLKVQLCYHHRLGQLCRKQCDSASSRTSCTVYIPNNSCSFAKMLIGGGDNIKQMLQIWSVKLPSQGLEFMCLLT